MSGLILKNVTLADGQRCNIVIKDNLIKEIVPAEQQCREEQCREEQCSEMQASEQQCGNKRQCEKEQHCEKEQCREMQASEQQCEKEWQCEKEQQCGNEQEHYQVLDAEGMMALPGFINMHCHSAMTLMRGAQEDDFLKGWLDKIWKMENNLTPDVVYAGTRLACLEMIKSGTTCFFDQYRCISASSKAAQDMGLRAFHAYDFMNFFDQSVIEKNKQECREKYEESKEWSPIANFAVSCHAPYSVSKELLCFAAEFAAEHNLVLNVHLSETEQEVKDCIAKHGKTPTEYLDSIGYLSSNVIAAHSLWLSERDLDIYTQRGVTAVHNINSNLKLASGYKFLYKEMKQRGINIAMGTDGCASSNNLDMLEAIKTMALVQKAWREDPTVMTLQELMEISSANAAKALGINAGRLEKGALADLMLVDTTGLAFVPQISPLANFIYAANSSCIDTLICNGKVLMRHRVVEGEEEILAQAREYAKHLLR